jgi:hypothetical protein
MARFGEGASVGRNDERKLRAGYVAGGTALGAGVAGGGALAMRSGARTKAAIMDAPMPRSVRPTRAEVERLPQRERLLSTGRDRRLAAQTGATGRTLGGYKARNTQAKRAYVRAHAKIAGAKEYAELGRRAQAARPAVKLIRRGKVALGVGAAIPLAALASSGKVARDWRNTRPLAPAKQPLLRDLKAKAKVDRQGLSVAEHRAAVEGKWDEPLKGKSPRSMVEAARGVQLTPEQIAERRRNGL